jgi:hypothetical protein
VDVCARRAPNWHLFFKNPRPTTVTELHATLRAGIAPARSLPQPRQASKHANNQLEQLARTGTEAEIQGEAASKGATEASLHWATVPFFPKNYQTSAALSKVQ